MPRHWPSALLALAATPAFAEELPPEAPAAAAPASTAPQPGALPGPPPGPPRGARLLRDGRITSLTGLAVAGTSGIVLAVGVPLSSVSADGDLFTPAIPAVSVALGAGITTAMVGVAVSGEGVRRMGLGPSWPGFVALGLLGAGGALQVPAFAPPRVTELSVVGAGVALAGFGFTVAQLVINQRALHARDAVAATRATGRPRLIVRAVPYAGADGGGGMVVGLW